MSKHLIQRKFLTEIHSRNGYVIVTYVNVACSCGDELVIHQRGDQLGGPDGFDVRDEIQSGLRHLRRLPPDRAEVEAIEEVVRVCVDPVPLPEWHPADLAAALRPGAERHVDLGRIGALFGVEPDSISRAHKRGSRYAHRRRDVPRRRIMGNGEPEPEGFADPPGHRLASGVREPEVSRSDNVSERVRWD